MIQNYPGYFYSGEWSKITPAIFTPAIFTPAIFTPAIFTPAQKKKTPESTRIITHV